MKWSEEAWQAILPVYQEICRHPFIEELKQGVLERAKFIFYMRQDALYIADFGRVLAGIAAKLENAGDRQLYLHFATQTVEVETALHEKFLGNFAAAQSQDPENSRPSPSCLLYSSYMYAQLANRAVEVAMATVLPCFWIYHEVGHYVVQTQSRDDNPYQDWIDTYGGEAFGRSVAQAIELTDGAALECGASRRAEMTAAFVTAAKMEWLFWDSAYRREQWKI